MESHANSLVGLNEIIAPRLLGRLQFCTQLLHQILERCPATLEVLPKFPVVGLGFFEHGQSNDRAPSAQLCDAVASKGAGLLTGLLWQISDTTQGF